MNRLTARVYFGGLAAAFFIFCAKGPLAQASFGDITLRPGVNATTDVMTLQGILSGIGYQIGTPDGVFGTSTENAVVQFQKAHGLTPDGVVGSSTIAALEGSSVHYVVQAGDTLSAIAQTKNVSVADLLAANPDANPTALQIGSSLLIPSLSGNHNLQSSTYIVQNGDTLGWIAQHYNVPVEAIMAANPGVNPITMQIGSPLTIPGSSYTHPAVPSSVPTQVAVVSPPPPTQSSYSYQVQTGDTIDSIAQRFGVTASDILKANAGLAPSDIIPLIYLNIPDQRQVLPSRGATDVITSIGYAVVTTAQRFLGTPYVYGATGPYAFDCSGLVQYVFGLNGIKLPRTSFDQFSFGTSVSMADLQPGDLLFFDSAGYGASHVGIYAGGGTFITAPSSGEVVKYENLFDPYWTDHFIGARHATS